MPVSFCTSALQRRFSTASAGRASAEQVRAKRSGRPGRRGGKRRSGRPGGKDAKGRSGRPGGKGRKEICAATVAAARPFDRDAQPESHRGRQGRPAAQRAASPEARFATPPFSAPILPPPVPLRAAAQVEAKLQELATKTSDALSSAPPSAAQATFTATGRLTGDVANVVRAGEYSVHIDEPPALGGEGAAPNPVEYALAALAGCQIVTYRVWAARLGVRLDYVKVAASGDIDLRGFFGAGDGVRPGFKDVRVTAELVGPEEPHVYEELRRTVDAHCPVHDLFSNATPVETKLGAVEDVDE